VRIIPRTYYAEFSADLNAENDSMERQLLRMKKRDAIHLRAESTDFESFPWADGFAHFRAPKGGANAPCASAHQPKEMFGVFRFDVTWLESAATGKSRAADMSLMGPSAQNCGQGLISIRALQFHGPIAAPRPAVRPAVELHFPNFQVDCAAAPLTAEVGGIGCIHIVELHFRGSYAEFDANLIVDSSN
jgi:hypothetical protein